MANRKRGGDDVASRPPSLLHFESAPPTTSEKDRVLAAFKYLHRDSRGERVITAELLEFMTRISAAKCRKIMEELEREGYAEAANGGWKYTGKR